MSYVRDLLKTGCACDRLNTYWGTECCNVCKMNVSIFSWWKQIWRRTDTSVGGSSKDLIWSETGCSVLRDTCLTAGSHVHIAATIKWHHSCWCCSFHLPVSVSLATTWAAPLSLAAMAEAPQPLPTSTTLFPKHSPGLSKRYLRDGVTGLKTGAFNQCVNISFN